MTLGREKTVFLNLPTPIQRLERISEDLNIDLYLKRDDLTNLGTGGNKLRKLEYFIRDAMDQKATMLLTVGGVQTNHGRLTAATAAKFGMKSAIIAVDTYPGEISANLLLDGIMDCHVYIRELKEGENYSDVMDDTVRRVTKEWVDKGEKVYFIPLGGSNELGSLGYYDCALEMYDQIREMELEDPHVFATIGSLGTYMGLLTAIENEDLKMRLTGVGISPFPDIYGSVLKYYERMRVAFALKKELQADRLDITEEFDYGDYNNPVKDVREAIYYMGRMEGIILDPCYTGKTFNAILQMVKTGRIPAGETVIMLHTGGIPGNYTKHHRIEMEKELRDHIHLI